MSVIRANEVDWEPHPFLPIPVKKLLTREIHQADVTIILVQLKAGQCVPQHVHPDAEDLIFPLQGKGRIHIQGEGEFELQQGVLARVPKRTKHFVQAETDLLYLDVFVPPIL